MQTNQDILLFETPASAVTDAEPRPAPARFLGWSLTVLFLTAALVLDALVLTWTSLAGGSWLQPATILGMSLVFAQQGLMAAACGWGRQHYIFRVTLFLSASAATGIFGSRYIGTRQMQGDFILMMLLQGSVVLVGVWCLRMRGWRLSLAGETPQVQPKRWQFQLIQLFAIMTSAAIILSLLQRLFDRPPLQFQYFAFGLLFSLTPLLLSFVVLARLPVAWIILSSAATVLATTLAIAWFLQILAPREGTAILFIAFYLPLLQGLFILAALSIVRLAGYSISTAPPAK